MYPYIRNLNSVKLRRLRVCPIDLKTWYMFNLVETKVKEPIPNRYLSTLIGTLTHYTLCIPNSHNPKNFKSSLMGELELDTVYKDFK